MMLTTPKAVKLPALLLLQIAFAAYSNGQRLYISTPSHFARWPYQNIYRFQVNGLPCEKVVVKADQGEMIQNGCELYYSPDSAGSAVFRTYKKTKNGLWLIDSTVIPVLPNELQNVQVGTRTGGPISKAEVLLLGGVIGREYTTHGHADGVQLVSYTIVVLRGDSAWSNRNVGRAFSTESQALLQTLQSGDKLIIADIQARGYKRSSISIRPAEYTIK